MTDHRLYIVASVVATEVPPDSPIEEFMAVIDVIRNRAKRTQEVGDLVMAVLAKNQFSAVCREDYWRRAMAGYWQPAHVQKCLDLVTQDWPDTTDGANYYYSPISMVPQWSAPSWAAKFEGKTIPGVRPDYFKFFKGAYP